MQQCHPKNISLITLLKLQVDTMLSEYIEKILSKLHRALWANNFDRCLRKVLSYARSTWRQAVSRRSWVPTFRRI